MLSNLTKIVTVKRIVLVLLVVFAALGLKNCGGNSWHQKLTVTVATPHGEVSGSSVSRVGITLREDALMLAPGYGYQASLSGEAVVVEVAPGKYLFAVLEEKQKLLALKVIAGDQAWGQPTKADLEKVEAHRGAVALGRSNYPLLVTFTDINAPASVKEVKTENLAASFGPGYSLKSITLEITDEAKTEDVVEKKLTWLDRLNGRVKPISEPIIPGYSPSVEEKLYSNSFIRGD
jgi:hypothetical protein